MPPSDNQRNDSELAFTGERFIPHQADPLLALEHYHRYCFASCFAQGKRILDMACGEGYGSAFLSKCANTVVGIDSDQATVDYARKKYSLIPNLTFEIGRCEDGPADQDGFDIVVGFELLEHLEPGDQVRFLENVQRVMKEDGLFILSSPEKNEYAATYQARNVFHKHELTLSELNTFLGHFFKNVHLCAQRVLSLSTMWQLGGMGNAQFRFHQRINLLQEIPAGGSFSSPLYLVALCSNGPLPDNAIIESNSFYLDVSNSDQTKDFSRWALQLNAEIQKDGDTIQKLQQQLQERTAWAIDLDRRIKDLDSRINERNQFIETLQKELDGRSQWALSLRAEAARERVHADEANHEIQRIRNEMSSSKLYRLLAKLKLIPNVRGK